MNDEQAREAVAAFREYFQPTGIYENEIYPGIEEMLKNFRIKVFSCDGNLKARGVC